MAKVACCVLLGSVALPEPAFSREKKSTDNAAYSVLAVSVDGKVTIEAVKSAEVAARTKKLDEDYRAAPKKDVRAPALIVLCENVKGKKKADGLARTLRTSIDRATGAAVQKRKPRAKKKPKVEEEPDGGGEGAGGADGAGGGEGGGE